MPSRSLYRELSISPSEPITRRNSVAGMLVLADALDPVTRQRTLLLKRLDHPPSTSPASSPAKRKARKVKAPVAQAPVEAQNG